MDHFFGVFGASLPAPRRFSRNFSEVGLKTYPTKRPLLNRLEETRTSAEGPIVLVLVPINSNYWLCPNAQYLYICVDAIVTGRWTVSAFFSGLHSLIPKRNRLHQ